MNVFAIDTRSLAVFRIAIAAVVLGDLAWRAPDISFFLTDSGALPRAELWRLDQNPYAWSVHALGGSWAWQAFLMLVQAAAAVALGVGWRTRWATVITWVLVVSLQTRNFQILQGGDVLLRCLLFWAMFLPLGARWSVDSRRTATYPESAGVSRVCSAASVALVVQIAGLYLCSGLLKWHPAWHTEGSALWYALHLDQFATPFGRWLRGHETWLPWLGRGALALELLGPFLALCPWRNEWCQGVAVIAFMGFHLGLMMCLELGLFPYVCWAAWTVLVPATWWNRLLPDSALDPQLRSVPPWWRETALLMLLAYVILWNARTVSFERVAQIFPRSANVVLEVPRLDQMWSMFAPYPLRDDGWYVAAASLSDGQRVDLITWLPPDERQPPGPPYATERWRKYLMNLYLPDNARWRPAALAALKRRWDDAHPQQLVLACDLRFWRKTNRLRETPTIVVENFAHLP